MTNDECRLTNGGIAPLGRFKIDRSTKDSRQAEYIIRRSMFDVRWFLFSDQTGRSRPAAAALLKLHRRCQVSGDSALTPCHRTSYINSKIQKRRANHRARQNEVGTVADPTL